MAQIVTNGVLLDTCALIWTVNDSNLNASAETKIQSSADSGMLFVNPMSAWEMSMLVSKNRLSLPTSVIKWFERIKENPGFQLADLSTEVLVESNILPGNPPNDPVDRIMIAMARENDFQLMTRDRPIIAYGEKGYVQILPC